MWKIAACLDSFGKQGYFPNFPSKFYSSDGTRGRLSYSANDMSFFGEPSEVDPPGGRYAMCLLELELVPLPKFEPIPMFFDEHRS